MRGSDPEKKDARESGTGVHVLASGLSMSRDGDECLWGVTQDEVASERIECMSNPRPLVPRQSLRVPPIPSDNLLAPKRGAYYPARTMLGPSKRVDFELTFAPSALERLMRVNARVDLERTHVVLPDGKRYPFFPDWRDHTWEGYTYVWHPNDPGNRRGLGIRYAPLGRVTIEAGSTGHEHQSFFDVLEPSDRDTDHPYFRRSRPELDRFCTRSQAPLGARTVVRREFLPGVTVTAPDSDTCNRALQTVEQVCGRALRAFHEERDEWVSWEKQGAAACAALGPGKDGGLARLARANTMEEAKRMHDERLEKPRRLLADYEAGFFEAIEYLSEEVLWAHSMLGGIEIHVAPAGVHHCALDEYLQRFALAERLYPMTSRAATALVIPEWERLGVFAPQESIGHPTLRVLEHELVHLLFHLIPAAERTTLRRYCRDTVKERRPVPYMSSLAANGHNEHGTALELVPTCGEMYLGSEGLAGQQWHRHTHPFLEGFFEKYIAR